MVLRIVSVASLAVCLGTGCGASEAGSTRASLVSGTRPEDSRGAGLPSSRPSGLDAQFLDVARQAPEFAGYYFDTSHRLVVVTTDLSAKERVRAAVQPLLEQHGIPASQAVEFRLGEYSWSQLYAWRQVMLNLGREVAESFNTLDADEVRNRVVVGVTKASDEAAVRQYAERNGVPAGALVVEVVDPVMVLPGGG